MIVVDNLYKTFGKDVKALDGLSFTAKDGEITGILGPNGAKVKPPACAPFTVC